MTPRNAPWFRHLLLGSLLAGGGPLAVPVQSAELSPAVIYYGMCDASAAVAVGTNFFIVANDEDNFLRIYRRHPGDRPYSTVDLTRFLSVRGKSPETDVEGAAHVGNRIYWITSHGRNARGKDAPDRHRFFATDVVATPEKVELIPVGRPYAHLLLDFAQDARLRKYGLIPASRLAPKDKGGLNIEGLTSMPDGSLLLGFRNPVPAGKALLLPLLNPAALIAGEPARLGDPIELDLGGLGVRSLGYENGRYLIIAGPTGGKGVFRLYSWTGPGATPAVIEGVNFTGVNPEGLTFEAADGRREYFVLSDDGTLKVGTEDCKRLPDPNQRRFRGYNLTF
jgi:hypothetical protein